MGRFPKATFSKPEIKPNFTSPCSWARWLMRNSFVVWDTETTGLEDDSAIVSFGAVSHTGEILVDTLINPLVPIPEEATAIHGVTDDMVKDAPTFAEVFPLIRSALLGQRWAIYNSAYDTARLDYECWRHAVLYPEPAIEYHRYGRHLKVESVHCAMNWYAEHYGDWSDYFSSYTWQSLGNAARQCGIHQETKHHALGDAITTLNLINHLALSEDRKKG